VIAERLFPLQSKKLVYMRGVGRSPARLRSVANDACPRQAWLGRRVAVARVLTAPACGRGTRPAAQGASPAPAPSLPNRSRILSTGGRPVRYCGPGLRRAVNRSSWWPAARSLTGGAARRRGGRAVVRRARRSSTSPRMAVIHPRLLAWVWSKCRWTRVGREVSFAAGSPVSACVVSSRELGGRALVLSASRTISAAHGPLGALIGESVSKSRTGWPNRMR